MSQDVFEKGKLQRIVPFNRGVLIDLVMQEGFKCDASDTDMELKELLCEELDPPKYVAIDGFGFCKILEFTSEKEISFMNFRRLPGDDGKFDVLEFETVYYNGGCDWREFLESEIEEKGL